MTPSIDFDRVDQYGPQTEGAKLALTPEQLERSEELRSGVDADVEVTTTKGDLPGEYLVDGNISYQGELFCARCLEPFPFATRATFNLRYMPRPADFGAPDAEVKVSDEELDLDYYDKRSVPLELIAQEQVLLSLPMKPLCEENCQGLCPGCGRNLSHGSCDCAEKVIDTRFESLREFRDQLAKKTEN